MQDLSVAEEGGGIRGGGTVTEKYLEVDARGARRGYAKEETSRSGGGGRGGKKKKKRFENSRGEESSGWVVE